MNKYMQRSDWLLLAAGLVGIIYFILSYGRIYPEAVTARMMPREEVLKRAETFLATSGIVIPDSLNQLNRKIAISCDNQQIRYLQELLGLKEANRVMASEVPACIWRLRWYVISQDNVRLGRNQEESPPESSDKGSQDKLTLQFDGRGHLTYYSCQVNEVRNSTAKSPELEPHGLAPALPPPVMITPDSAKIIALAFIQSLGWIDLTEFSDPETNNSTQRRVQRNEFSNAQTNEFIFTSKQKKYGESITFKVKLNNSYVNGFDFHFQTPPDFVPLKERPFGKVQQVTDAVVILTFSLLVIIFFFKRFRSGAFDIKLGVFFGVLSFLVFGVMMYAFIGTDSWLIFLMIIIFGGSWWMLATGVVVAVTGSLAHDVWPEKYQTFEAIRRGKFLNRKFGLSLLRGMLWAGVLLGAVSLVLTLIPQTSVTTESETEAAYGSLGAVFIICAVTYSVLLNAHAVWLLALSALRKKIQNPWILCAIGMCIGILTPFLGDHTAPLAARLLLGIILGGISAYVLLRHDFLTLFTMIFLANIIQPGFALILGHDVVQSSTLIIFLTAVGVTAVIGTFSRESGEDILDYVPEYVKEIENKQRMQREFEIARHIQTNLLCRTTPHTEVFDVASFCEPAYEVGGDYYDFIAFPDSKNKKIGVVIGDVSGKGVSAAFYSTLVKGIVQTQAGITPHSTKQTLARVNDIFYEQVQRGKFISMIYAIFDFDQKKVLLARAGHNPVLIKKSNENEPETVTPRGIAIGLTRGKAFDDSMDEIEIPFKPNDVFVFYTDGFSEAMNKRGEEYGEERLTEIIQKHASALPQTIIEAIQKDVASHTGATPQHDDMTMIVVKVKS
jgi:sigma-B regulation protein RsbU (phosphoserine phosphatase)